MSDLLGKISSYYLFNYLFTGVLFVAVSDKFTSFSFKQDDIVIALFVYYFIGLVLSRIGSLIIEPILKKIHFVKFSEYKDYIFASKNDSGIETLSEANNMYRTLCALFLVIIILKIYSLVEVAFPKINTLNLPLLVGTLFIMFLFSYRKQTSYITKRIEANKSK